MIHVPGEDDNAAELAPLFLDGGREGCSVGGIVLRRMPCAGDCGQIGVVDHRPPAAGIFPVVELQFDVGERLGDVSAVFHNSMPGVALLQPWIYERVRPSPIVARRVGNRLEFVQ